MRVLIFDNVADIINVVESNKIKLCKQLNDIVFRVFTEEKVYEIILSINILEDKDIQEIFIRLKDKLSQYLSSGDFLDTTEFFNLDDLHYFNSNEMGESYTVRVLIRSML